MSPELDYYNPDDLDVRVAELLVATTDGADEGVPPRVQEVLRLLRERMMMDVVFVSEFVQDRRVFRYVERVADAVQLSPGQSDPVESSWCQQVAQGRVPELIQDAAPLVRQGRLPDPGIEIGTHISTPIRSPSGEPLGTLCCFSRAVQPHACANDLKRLQHTAQLLVDVLDAGNAPPVSPAG